MHANIFKTCHFKTALLQSVYKLCFSFLKHLRYQYQYNQHWYASYETCLNIEGMLPKGPYLLCVSMAGRAPLAGCHRYMKFNMTQWSPTYVGKIFNIDLFFTVTCATMAPQITRIVAIYSTVVQANIQENSKGRNSIMEKAFSRHDIKILRHWPSYLSQQGILLWTAYFVFGINSVTMNIYIDIILYIHG